jgi:3-dehydroquinate synthase
MRRHVKSGHKDKVYTMLLNSTIPLRSRVDFGPSVRHRTGNILRQVECGKKILLLHQTSLPKQWLDDLLVSLQQQNFDVTVHTLPDGEDAKSLEQLTACWEIMQGKEFTRADSVVAIGGGAVSDLGGFCAASYLRGINLFLLPTTLLAQVDASIGGKTGINLRAGKNLAGSFYFPQSVIVDPEFLTTLPAREFRAGMGEIVKYAFIEDTIAENTDYQRSPAPLARALADNFSSGLSADNPFLAPLISICIQMKLAVVLKDPFEGRLRRCLNLGHTLGHGLEKVTAYGISHGEAVTIGTVFAFKLAVDRGMIAEAELQKVEQLLKIMQLPYEIPNGIDVEKLVQSVAFDKKRTGAGIKYVLPEKDSGRVNLDTTVPVDELADFIRSSLPH